MHGRGMHGGGVSVARGHACGGPCMAGGMCDEGHVWQGHLWQGACVAGGMCGRGTYMVGGMYGRRNGNCIRRYASYWNAFLSIFVTKTLKFKKRTMYSLAM